MKVLNQSLESLILQTVADDYEDIDSISADLAAGVRVPSAPAQREAIVLALQELISNGLVTAYKYDSALCKFLVTTSEEDPMYYYATDEGKALVNLMASEKTGP